MVRVAHHSVSEAGQERFFLVGVQGESVYRDTVLHEA